MSLTGFEASRDKLQTQGSTPKPQGNALTPHGSISKSANSDLTAVHAQLEASRQAMAVMEAQYSKLTLVRH